MGLCPQRNSLERLQRKLKFSVQVAAASHSTLSAAMLLFVALNGAFLAPSRIVPLCWFCLPDDGSNASNLEAAALPAQSIPFLRCFPPACVRQPVCCTVLYTTSCAVFSSWAKTLSGRTSLFLLPGLSQTWESRHSIEQQRAAKF